MSKASPREGQQRRIRVLPVDGSTLDMLRDYVRRGGPVLKDGQQLIFGINRHRAWQVVRDCAERAGLSGFGAWDLGSHRKGVSAGIQAIQEAKDTHNGNNVV